MRLAFSLFDTDGDGVINAGEAKAVFKTLGISESEETINAMVKRLDTSGMYSEWNKQKIIICVL